MKLLNWFLISLCVLGLISVRVVETRLFYDPLLDYFKVAGSNEVFPKLDFFKLTISHLFRFGLNLLFSGLLVHFIFKNKNWSLQAVLLMIIVFAITFPIYLYCVYTEFSIGELFSFYMRRFVIQPITVLLIIPIFYYRRHLLKA